jgi:hypothetical protein
MDLPRPADPSEEDDDAYSGCGPENPSAIKVSVSRPDQIRSDSLSSAPGLTGK